MNETPQIDARAPGRVGTPAVRNEDGIMTDYSDPETAREFGRAGIRAGINDEPEPRILDLDEISGRYDSGVE